MTNDEINAEIKKLLRDTIDNLDTVTELCTSEEQLKTVEQTGGFINLIISGLSS